MSPPRRAERAPGRFGARAAAVLVLFALPLCLRLWPIEHGLPRNYVPDTHVVRGALGMARDKNLVPPAALYTSYPYLVPYALLPIYAAEYALGRALGRWGGSGEFALRVTQEPALVHLPARILIALVGALTPWAVFRAARAAGMARGAWFAAWLTATALLHVQFSTQERPWIAMVLFLVLALWAAARYAAAPSIARLAWCGAAAGLSFAAHQSGLAVLGVPALAWLASGPGWTRADLRPRLAQGLAACLAFAAVGLVIGHPYLLVHGQPERSAISGGEALVRELARDPGSFTHVFHIGAQAVVLAFRPETFTRLTRALAGYDPAAIALGLLGLFAAWKARTTRAAALFALGWAAFFLTNQNDHVRYLLPLVVLLALFGGWAGELLWQRRALRLPLLALLALPLVQALRLGWLLRQPDTRALAEIALARTAGLDLVLVDRYGPQSELDRASLERLSELRPLERRERERLEWLQAGATEHVPPGLPIVPLGDVFNFDDRRAVVYPTAGAAARWRAEGLAVGTDPTSPLAPEELRAACAATGASHLLLVNRRPKDIRRHPLLPVIAELEPEWVIDPSERGVHPEEAFLPTEMEFPLTELWQVARPGPWLGLYRVDPSER